MASIDWPASLDCVLYEGFTQAHVPPVIRSSMGYGPDKVRARATAEMQLPVLQMSLTDAQRDDLLNFYQVTTQFGVLRFNWRDHVSGADPVEYRFRGPPAFRPDGPSHWRASLSFEIVP